MNRNPQHDITKRPGRKKKKLPSPKQEKYINALVETGSKKEALKIAGYSHNASPETFKVVQDALAERQKEMQKKFMDDAEEMRNNMLNLARNSSSEAVKFQATKDILDRAGLNPVNKNQTESAKYISIEDRVSRGALARYEKELEAKKEQGT